MNNGEKIIANLINQSDYLYNQGLEPSRVILGERIVNILRLYHTNNILTYEPIDKECSFMGLPVTIDYQDKWILMVCVGDKCNGRYWLEDN